MLRIKAALARTRKDISRAAVTKGFDADNPEDWDEALSTAGVNNKPVKISIQMDLFTKNPQLNML
jgi:hypothetical protein